APSRGLSRGPCAEGWNLVLFSPMNSAQPPTKYTIGLVQMSMSADPDANLKQGVAKVEEAAAAGARLVCLPELFRSLYFAQREDAALFDLAEPVPGPSTEALAKAAQRAGVVVIAPVFERRAPGLYHNSAAVIDADGRIVGIYRKMHIPDDPAYYEKFYFTPGDLGFRAFDTRVGRIGTLVCWGQGGGSGDGIEFWGSSFLADPFGAVVAEAPQDREAILIAEVDLARIEEVRRGWPFLRDRRIDAYAGIGARFLDQAPSAIGHQQDPRKR